MTDKRQKFINLIADNIKTILGIADARNMIGAYEGIQNFMYLNPGILANVIVFLNNYNLQPGQYSLDLINDFFLGEPKELLLNNIQRTFRDLESNQLPYIQADVYRYFTMYSDSYYFDLLQEAMLEPEQEETGFVKEWVSEYTIESQFVDSENKYDVSSEILPELDYESD